MSKKRQPIPTKPPNSKLGSGQGNLAQELLVKGFGHHQQGDLIAAGEIYAQILKIQPLHFDALHLSGLIAAKSEQFEIAESLILKAISINPNNAPAYCNLGNVFLNQAKHDLAIENYSRALALKPYYEEAFYSRGLAHQRLGNLHQAQNDYYSALQINPKHIGTLTNLGNTYQLQKKYDEAISWYQRAIELQLPVAEPFNNRGNLYHEQKRYQEALLDFERALDINPNYPEALSNKGNSLFALKRYEEALACYNKAISLKPMYAEAYHNRANLLRELKRYEFAASDYKNALALKPNYEYVQGVLLGTRMNLCEWDGLEVEWNAVEQKIRGFEKVISPFLTLPISDSIEIQRKVAELWVNEKYPIQPIPKFNLTPIAGRKIRIGYFSADFHEHATMYLMAQLFELHDKDRFETIGFSFGPNKQDSMRKRAVDALDQFYDVRDKTDGEIAQLSRDLGVDIAVDLKGFTLDSRAGIFSYRAAPIQINYLGYPGTMGAKFIDYIIADRVVIPEGLRHLYSEEVAYLPGCYQVNDQKRLISERVFTKQELGLPSNGFVYCCFNANYKITPSTFDVWMRILQSTPGSVLWLYQDSEISAENLRKEAEKRGVEQSRLVFAKQMPLDEHLARHRLADLFLDTLPCNAHTTTSDALWAGLPVLTCAGQTFASRVAASLLTAVGMSELVTSSHAEYEKLAVKLAKDSRELIKYKTQLSEGLKKSTLFDTEKFTKDLEALYCNLLERASNRALVVTKKTKFTIVAPNYNDKSGGSWVLHFLCDQLNKVGYSASLFIYEKEQLVNPSFDTPIEFDPDSIVIYPEIVTNNPLNASRVVRYLLNREGHLQGRMIDWSPTDYPLTFSKVYRDNCDSLFYPNTDLNIFYPDDTEKKQNAFYIGKGNLYGDCPQLPCLEITRQLPPTKHELASALRGIDIFYSYDAHSATNLDAALCGCVPLLLQKPMKGIEHSELGKFWAESEGEIEGARVAIQDLYQRTKELQDNFQDRLRAQMEKIEKHFNEFSTVKSGLE